MVVAAVPDEHKVTQWYNSMRFAMNLRICFTKKPLMSTLHLAVS